MSLILRIVFIAVAMICDKVLMIDGVQSSKLGDFYRIGKELIKLPTTATIDFIRNTLKSIENSLRTMG